MRCVQRGAPFPFPPCPSCSSCPPAPSAAAEATRSIDQVAPVVRPGNEPVVEQGRVGRQPPVGPHEPRGLGHRHPLHPRQVSRLARAHLPRDDRLIDRFAR